VGEQDGEDDEEGDDAGDPALGGTGDLTMASLRASAVSPVLLR
jgi:hypothetical protein